MRTKTIEEKLKLSQTYKRDFHSIPICVLPIKETLIYNGRF